MLQMSRLHRYLTFRSSYSLSVYTDGLRRCLLVAFDLGTGSKSSYTFVHSLNWKSDHTFENEAWWSWSWRQRSGRKSKMGLNILYEFASASAYQIVNCYLGPISANQRSIHANEPVVTEHDNLVAKEKMELTLTSCVTSPSNFLSERQSHVPSPRIVQKGESWI